LPRATRLSSCRRVSFDVSHAHGRAVTSLPYQRRRGLLDEHSAVRLRALMPLARASLIEFPADDPERARRFWSGVLGLELEPRRDGEGEGWQTQTGAPAVGVHVRGRGPGDSFSLPYFAVDDLVAALERVSANGGAVVHPGEVWAICRDSEGSPFALAQNTGGA
jgi:predicted enzyme related to lactoylglutathione lyase